MSTSLRQAILRLEVSTTSDTDVVDLTGEVRGFVESSGVRDGMLLMFVPGSTAALTTIEFEAGAVSDLKQALERVVPRDGEYEHDLRWGDGNGYAHVRAALMGPSMTVPITNGRPELGTWQQIVLCDFDNRPRKRRITLQAWGN